MKKIKKKIQGNIKNITEKSTNPINEYCIINKNKITYNKDNITHTIYIKDDTLLLTRENEIFKHGMLFNKGKTKLSSYYLKENNLCLDIPIETIDMSIIYNNEIPEKIYIKYKVSDNDNIYEYKVTIGGI